MKCDGVRGLLSAYLDGELSAGELLQVEQHLRRCHACADEVDSLRQTVALVSSMEEVELPADFHVRLHDRLVAVGPPTSATVRRLPAASSWQRSMRRWAVPAAAAAAAITIGFSWSLPKLAQSPDGLMGVAIFNKQPDAPKVDVADNATIAPDPDKQAPSPQVEDNVKPPGLSTDTTGPKKDDPNAGNPAEPGKGPNSGGPVIVTDDPPKAPTIITQPRMQLMAVVTATVTDKAKALEMLKHQADYANYRPGTDDSRLVFVVPVADYEKATAFFKQLLGGTVKDTSYNAAPDLNKVSLNLDSFQAQLNPYEKSPPTDEPTKRTVEDLKQRIAELKEEQKVLTDRLNTAEITIVLETAR